MATNQVRIKSSCKKKKKKKKKEEEEEEENKDFLFLSTQYPLIVILPRAL